MKITDTVTLAGVRVNDSGYLEANARTARTGIQKYLGVEMGRPELAVVNVYRAEDEVFKKASLDTFSKLPITMDHPAEMVDANNWKDLAVGTTGDDVLRDGEFLKIGLKITDADAVKAVEGGKRQLSVGYMAEIEFVDGITPDGEPYQAVQRNIEANHVAIVDAARAGPQARIGDSADHWGASPITVADKKGSQMADNLRTIMVDGLSVSTTDAGAQAIEKLQGEIQNRDTALTDVKATHKAEIEAKDTTIGELKAELKTAKDAAPDAAKLDKLVADRAALVAIVKTVDADAKVEGVSDADLRKAAVAKVYGDDMVADASDAEITGMFKAVAKDAKSVTVADTIAGTKPAAVIDMNAKYAERDKRLADAHKRKEA